MSQHNNIIAATWMAVIAVATPAMSEEASVDGQSAAREIVPVEGFVDTGESVNCLKTYQINNTRIIDNSTILFEMNGNKYYVNRLPQRCPGLKIEGGFSYTLRGLNQLCNTDSIRVISSQGPRAVCMLSSFDQVEKVKK